MLPATTLALTSACQHPTTLPAMQPPRFLSWEHLSQTQLAAVRAASTSKAASAVDARQLLGQCLISQQQSEHQEQQRSNQQQQQPAEHVHVQEQEGARLRREIELDLYAYAFKQGLVRTATKSRSIGQQHSTARESKLWPA